MRVHGTTKKALQKGFVAAAVRQWYGFNGMEKRKKILYVITKSNFGGAQRYVFDLATSLSPNDYIPAVALGGSGILKKKLEEKNIRVISCPSLERDVNPLRDAASFFALLKLFRKEQPDVVHLNSSKAGGIGALAARAAGVPKIIFTAHAWAFNENRTALSKALIRFLSWATVMLCHRTIAVSNAVIRGMQNLPFAAKKITVIPNGINPVSFYSKGEARRALALMHPALDAYENDLWLGTIAELHPVKGLSYAIEAVPLITKTYPRLRYLIAGEGDERAALEKLIEERGLGQHVFLLGFVDNAPQYGKAYDLFLLPSLSESFGISILEAGLSGVPAIATAVGGIPEFITDGKTGRLVAPRSSRAIAEAVRELLLHGTRAESYARKLEENVREHFPLSRMISKTLELYR